MGRVKGWNRVRGHIPVCQGQLPKECVTSIVHSQPGRTFCQLAVACHRIRRSGKVAFISCTGEAVHFFAFLLFSGSCRWREYISRCQSGLTSRSFPSSPQLLAIEQRPSFFLLSLVQLFFVWISALSFVHRPRSLSFSPVVYFALVSYHSLRSKCRYRPTTSHSLYRILS